MRLRWQDSMILGVPEMDASHRHLFHLLDAVALAVEARMLEASQISVGEFLEAAFEHLASEEALFERIAGQHNRARHMATHNEARRTFKRLPTSLSATKASTAKAPVPASWARRSLGEIHCPI